MKADNNYNKLDNNVEKIINMVSKYMTNLNIQYIRSEILKAYEYAKKAHEGQVRLSGDPYLVHPVKSVEILLSLKPDLYTIQACFLHDVIEDTPKTKDDINEVFGEEVAFLCEGMEKLSKVKYRGEERNIGSLRKMFIAMAEDLRIIFIKLADRLHNMETLRFHPNIEKRERIALETLNIYSPIADRLGLYNFKNSLDEECYKILEFHNYKKLKKELKELEPSIEAFTNNAKKEITKLFKGKLDNFEIDFRVKSIYSIHKKIQKKGLTHAKELYDLFGIRVIVENEADCYRALGIIHSSWTPIPQRFKDYIALPKPNGYRSLHTNVMGLVTGTRKQPTEIQIKTSKMKEYSDIGVAAHFEYKEKGSKISKEINWVKELKELTNNVGDTDFVGSLKVDVFKDRIFVFTPKGDFINLPAGSTPIDFAYYVHTELGNHVTLAKVNGAVFPLDKELHNGDVVEIIIDKNKKPNPFWISFVKTVKAKNRIKSFLKKENKDPFIEKGREMMNKYLEKTGLDLLDKDLTLLKNIDGVIYNKEERLNFLEQVGNFSINPSLLIKKILKTKNPILGKKNGTKNINEKLATNTETKNLEKINLIIGGEKDLPYKLGHCCRRKLSNDIVAHINGKGIITIHKRNCTTLIEVNKKRLLSAYLEGKQDESLIFEVELIIKNITGVLKDLTDIIFTMGIDVDEIQSNKISKFENKINLKLKILDYDYLVIDRFIERLEFKFKSLLISSKIGKIIKDEEIKD